MQAAAGAAVEEAVGRQTRGERYFAESGEEDSDGGEERVLGLIQVRLVIAVVLPHIFLEGKLAS